MNPGTRVERDGVQGEVVKVWEDGACRIRWPDGIERYYERNAIGHAFVVLPSRQEEFDADANIMLGALNSVANNGWPEFIYVNQKDAKRILSLINRGSE